MKYSPEFKKLLDLLSENNQYVGLGNPNANILIVGKEPGSESGKEHTHGSAKSWIEKKIDYSDSYPAKENLRNYNHTWQKYQKLYELILSQSGMSAPQKNKYDITFVENIFTTELSNLSAFNTKEAKALKDFQEELDLRKKSLFKSDFINDFPVVIIAASDNKYIETYRGEVCEIFGVKFDQEVDLGNSNKIWVHYAEEDSENYPKLVLHTRQLTNGASNKLLEELSILVAEFIKDHSIKILVK